jgi:hypothetical protein
VSDAYAGLSVPPKLFIDQTKVMFSDGVPADLSALQSTTTKRAAFRRGQYVTLGDGTRARWDGSEWTDISPVQATPFDPGDHSITDIKARIDDEGRVDELDAILDAERAGKGRKTLIDWLESHPSRSSTERDAEESEET